ncbi:MAG: PDZ domain-containing protein [Nitrospira sp.]|jgi:hypothetical protein|nr:PDZ domain-containing protein [Nitrospira sp.]
MAILIVAVFSILLCGCAMARGQHEVFDTAQLVPVLKAKEPHDVRVYQEGSYPDTGCFKVAYVAAHGNGYATKQTLETKLQEETAELGGDSVIIYSRQINNGMTVGTYGGGIAMADTIRTPSLYGVACRIPHATTGARVNGKDKEYSIKYVSKGSPAEAAGLLEGDKLLTLNGRLIDSDPLLFEKEIGSKRPGDRLQVEYMRDGKKQSATVTLASPSQF